MLNEFVGLIVITCLSALIVATKGISAPARVFSFKVIKAPTFKSSNAESSEILRIGSLKVIVMLLFISVIVLPLAGSKMIPGGWLSTIKVAPLDGAVAISTPARSWPPDKAIVTSPLPAAMV